ncbi:MAG: isochorismatase family protein, partial [Pseudomonadota bacterium]
AWGGPRNNLAAEANALALVAAWRPRGWPIVWVQHASQLLGSPLGQNCPGFAFKDGFTPEPGDMHVVKHENSAFVGTHLDVLLRRSNITDLVICGITTEHCVSTTTRMAANLGFCVQLVGDACHAWPKNRNGVTYDSQTVHDTELAILDGEFANVMTTRGVLDSL